MDDERNKTEEHLAPCCVERRVDMEEEEEGEKDETWGRNENELAGDPIVEDCLFSRPVWWISANKVD